MAGVNGREVSNGEYKRLLIPWARLEISSFEPPLVWRLAVGSESVRWCCMKVWFSQIPRGGVCSESDNFGERILNAGGAVRVSAQAQGQAGQFETAQ
jgi:hypothetical protein